MHMSALIVGALATILSSSVMGICSIWLHESNRFSQMMSPYFQLLGGTESNTTSFDDEAVVQWKFHHLIKRYINETDNANVEARLAIWRSLGILRSVRALKKTEMNDDNFEKRKEVLYHSVVSGLKNLLGPDFSHYVKPKDDHLNNTKSKDFDVEFKKFLYSFRKMYISYGYTDPYLKVSLFFSALEILTAGLLLYGANESISSLLWPWFIVNIIIFGISFKYMIVCFKYNYATLGIIILCILIPFRVMASISFVILHKKIRLRL